MANDIWNKIFVKGTKQSVVDFLNRGLKGNKAKERVSLKMTGEEIASFLNGLECPLMMESYFPMPKTFSEWDTTNNVKGFFDWYADGCVANQIIDEKLSKKRQKEVEDYMNAHPEAFPQKDEDRALEMLHPELKAEYQKYVKGYQRAARYQKEKYGVVGWLDWYGANYGCEGFSKMQEWSVVKDTEDAMCLSAKMWTEWDSPITFIERIANLPAITVCACGRGDNEFVYKFNGETNELEWVDSEKDILYEKYMKEWEQREDYAPDDAYFDVTDRIVHEYIEKFEKELGL